MPGSPVRFIRRTAMKRIRGQQFFLILTIMAILPNLSAEYSVEPGTLTRKAGSALGSSGHALQSIALLTLIWTCP
ncbi:MAG TPA: hypothetical protein DCS21_03235 [Gammaproteobacteria bacterium]|nr:hypothetical protein [Gammaproteobacteria bacterium]